MRKSVCILSFVLLLGAVAAFAQTGTTASTATATTATSGTGATGTTTTTTTTHKGHKHAAAKSAHGTVSAKDDTAKTFAVHPKTGTTDWTFDTNDSTKYWLNGKAATWADLAVGQIATVAYKVDGDKKWATKVKLTTPKDATKKPS